MLSRRSAIAAGLLCPIAARATSPYPSRNVTLIAPFAPGASADGIARIVGEGLAARLGKPVVVENRAGAGGTTGLIALARSEADGHTLGVGATGALVVNPHVPASTAAFDPLRELAPIAKLIDIPIVLVANAKSGIRTVADLIRASKENPEGVSYGTTGVNSSQHLAVELLRRSTNAKLVHVPYRGSAPALTDLLGGAIPLASLDLTSAEPHIRSGAVVGLAVTSNARVPYVPDVPTIAETAVPGFDLRAWIGLFGPASLPSNVVERVANDVAAVLSESAVKQKIQQLSCVPDFMGPTAFRDFLTTTSRGMGELVRSLSAT